MTFLELARRRYSTRAYRPDPVPDDLLAAVLEAGRVAPTAANKQPFRVIVIHTAGREAELRRIYDREWFVQAPLLLCVCAVREEAWSRTTYDGRSHADVDAAIVMDHMILAAADLGLGTCWIAAFDPAAAREVLGVPPEGEPMLFTPLGFGADDPAGSARHRVRRPLEDLVRYERW
jgi:nitroreductase